MLSKESRPISFGIRQAIFEYGVGRFQIGLLSSEFCRLGRAVGLLVAHTEFQGVKPDSQYLYRKFEAELHVKCR